MNFKDKWSTIAFVSTCLFLLLLIASGIWKKHQEWIHLQSNLAQRRELDNYRLQQGYDFVHTNVRNYSPTDKGVDYVGGTIQTSSTDYSALYIRYTYPPFWSFDPSNPKTIILYLTEDLSDDIRPKSQPEQVNYFLPPETHSVVQSRNFTPEQIKLLSSRLEKLSQWVTVCQQTKLDVKQKSFFALTSADGKRRFFDASFSYENNKAVIRLDFDPYNSPNAYDPNSPGDNIYRSVIDNCVDVDYKDIACLEKLLTNALTEYSGKYAEAFASYESNLKTLQLEKEKDEVNQAKADALLK